MPLGVLYFILEEQEGDHSSLASLFPEKAWFPLVQYFAQLAHNKASCVWWSLSVLLDCNAM